MALSQKAKSYIRKHAGKKKAGIIASELKVFQSEVETYIKTLETTDTALSVDPGRRHLFTLAALFIPVLFFVCLEIGLRVGNYRGNTDLFVYPAGLTEYARVNTNFAARYFFYTRVIPTPIPDFFKRNKPENGFRVFVMGESSAAGYPYPPNGAFSRIVEDMLQDVMPDYEVEVINVAMSAINTYTLFDQIDEIVEKQPDVILIYTGHNEYYGALGVGSTENIGSFPAFVRFYLKIQRYKTFMLLRDGVVRLNGWIRTRFTGSQRRDVTLMQQVVREQIIPLGSPVYELGNIQFRSNMNAIIKKFQKAGIPVFLSSVASNLKDHRPFESVESGTLPSAWDIFDEATNLYERGELTASLEKYILARDLDALRFRASTDINLIIKELAEQSGVYYVPAEERLLEVSTTGIIGFDLMLEHLHPNQLGYFTIGSAFFETLKNATFLEGSIKKDRLKPYSEYFNNMHLTELDNQIVKHRMLVLTNNWPFVRSGSPFSYSGYRFESYTDSLAFEVVANKKRWDEAKVELGEYYRERGMTDASLAEFQGLIRDQPYLDSPFVFAARALLDAGQLERAYPYLIKAHEMDPSAYTYKMLGAIEINRGNFRGGADLIETSLELNPVDVQAMYNLSGAYGQLSEFDRAMEIVLEIEKINPLFPGLASWKEQLERVIRK